MQNMAYSSWWIVYKGTVWVDIEEYINIKMVSDIWNVTDINVIFA